MQILRASEDYLEAMLMMQQEHGYIRSIDIADKLGVTKPSVTYATKRLRENGYITMDKDGLITLTEQGMAIAASMLDRHHTLTRFLMALGVDEETAETPGKTIDLREKRALYSTYSARFSYTHSAASTAPPRFFSHRYSARHASSVAAAKQPRYHTAPRCQPANR